MTLACAAVVGAGDDHARARAAYKAGEIVSLQAILSLGVLAIALFAAAAIQVRVGLRPLYQNDVATSSPISLKFSHHLFRKPSLVSQKFVGTTHMRDKFSSTKEIAHAPWSSVATVDANRC